jgi:hypothetical protein
LSFLIKLKTILNNLHMNSKIMKTKIVAGICLVLLFFPGITSNAQSKGPMDPMLEGSWLLNFGVGPGIRYYSGYATGFGPGFQVACERGMWQLGPGVLSLGAELGMTYFWYSNYYNGDKVYTYHWMSIIPAVRASYHYGWKVKGLDTYGGIATGPRFLAFSDKYYNGYEQYVSYSPGSVGFFFGTYVGASYFFNHVLGVNGELGYNVTWAQVGLTFKIY